MLVVEVVLGAAGGVLAVGVDEQDLATALLGAASPAAQDQDAGGDAGSVEQVRRKTDDGFEAIGLDDLLADVLFLTAPEEDAVGHDGGADAVGHQDGQDVLGEHQVRLLAGLGGEAVPEALGVLHPGGAAVLEEGRVGEHPVEAHELAALLMEGVGEGVVVTQVGVEDTMQDHVHLGDGPGAAVVLLARQGHTAPVLAVFLHVLLGVDEHAAGAGAGVIDAHAGAGLDQADHHADDATGGVELAALLAGRVGELADQVLVCRAEQVGELEVLVAQPVAVEVVDEGLQPFVGDGGLADLAREVDVLQHALEGGGVRLRQRVESLVEQAADALATRFVLDVPPAGLFRDEEALASVEQRGVRGSLGLFGGAALGDQLRSELLSDGVELVRGPLQ